MPDEAVRALLIIDEDSLGHNSRLIPRLESLFRLTVDVRRRRSARLAGRTALIVRESALLFRLFTSPWPYRRRSVVLCSSGHYAALVASRLAGVTGADLRIVLYNFYLHGLGERRFVRGVLRFLLTGRVTIAAQSRRDLEYFDGLQSGARPILVPYRQDPVAGFEPGELEPGDFVFAGGYSNRDYDTLLRAARGLPDVRFVLALSSLNKVTVECPPNVVIEHDLDWEAFHRLLARARLVVIPLAADVGASGQMVCLAAMQFARPLVVPDFDCLTQYVDEGAGGLVYRAGDADDLCRIVTEALSDPHLLRTLGRTAQDRYFALFTRQRFDDAIVREAERLAGSQPVTVPAAP
jgi:glycosyltransferase involved in cell wall biosynthesis